MGLCSWQRLKPEAALALVEFATHKRENSNGVCNTVVGLSEYSRRALQKPKQGVFKFIEVVKATGPKTEAKAIALENA